MPLVTLSRLGDLSESALLRLLAPVYAVTQGPRVAVGPGDDAAVVAGGPHGVVVTTDSVVRGLDWRDDWSSGQDVGRKLVIQNVADVLAMGGRPTALVVSLSADPQTPLDWVLALAEGIAAAALETGCAVVGGDLGSAPSGVVALTMTALGDAPEHPVLRSGAQVGDQVAVAGTLGWSGGGLALLSAGRGDESQVLTDYHRVPRVPMIEASAAVGRVHALADISDGLVTDVRRIAQASRVTIDLDEGILSAEAVSGPLGEVFGAEDALHHVLSGGEEHSLVGCFPVGPLPAGWRRVGSVVGPGSGSVTVAGQVIAARGWDHFGG